MRIFNLFRRKRSITSDQRSAEQIRNHLVERSGKRHAIHLGDFDSSPIFEPFYDYGHSDLTNERNLALWKYGELIKTLITLSSIAHRQKELVGAGAVADEMAEDFNRYFTESIKQLKEYQLVTDAHCTQLSELDQFLDMRSGDCMPDFWDNSSLESHPDWNTVRQMARDILVAMGMEHLDIAFDRTEKYTTTSSGQQLTMQTTKSRLVKKEDL